MIPIKEHGIKKEIEKKFYAKGRYEKDHYYKDNCNMSNCLSFLFFILIYGWVKFHESLGM